MILLTFRSSFNGFLFAFYYFRSPVKYTIRRVIQSFVSNIRPREFIPFLFKFHDIFYSWLVRTVNFSCWNSPRVLDRVRLGTRCWPRRRSYCKILEPLFCSGCRTNRSIVSPKDRRFVFYFGRERRQFAA